MSHRVAVLASHFVPKVLAPVGCAEKDASIGLSDRQAPLMAHKGAVDNSTYNPEWNPNGDEAAIDTNQLPWIPLDSAPGMFMKPMRASDETGYFSMVLKVAGGASQPDHIYLGAMDFFVLSGKMTCPSGPLAGDVCVGTWGYIPANARVGGLTAGDEGCEYVANFFGPVAFLNATGKVRGLLTSMDVKAAAREAGIPLIPNTLADAMRPRPAPYAGESEPLEMSKGSNAALVIKAEGVATTAPVKPHYVDTRQVPWIVSEEMPDVGLKILRVSAETGVTSMLVRHNGTAPPHYHLGASDFMVISGRIGVRAGPPEGYGPGVWFWEPAGARHESTSRIGTDDLIYTANVYGPIQFDEGVGTPIAMVLSWMQYMQQAQEAKAPLVRSTFSDGGMVAWAPLVGAE
jgi:quercetin dioxygenase-like cupin family protein